MQTEVYASLDDMTKAALVRKKVELCYNYFLKIASNLNRNKYKGCYAPHKAVMIMAIMELVESRHITANVIHLDKKLKDKFKEVWQRGVLQEVRSNANTEIRSPIWIVSPSGICPPTKTRHLSHGKPFMPSRMKHLAPQ